MHSAQDYFPFGLLQLAASLPLLGVLLRRQWRDNTLAAVLGGYAVVFLVVSYLSRIVIGAPQQESGILLHLKRAISNIAIRGAIAPCTDGHQCGQDHNEYDDGE